MSKNEKQKQLQLQAYWQSLLSTNLLLHITCNGRLQYMCHRYAQVTDSHLVQGESLDVWEVIFS